MLIDSIDSPMTFMLIMLDFSAIAMVFLRVILTAECAES